MDLTDVFIFIGILLIGVGFWLIQPSFSFIFSGFIFLALGIYSALKKGGEKT